MTTTFEDLYAAYHQPIRARILFMTQGDLDRVDDLLQETFFRVWRAYGRLDHRKNLYAWCYTIATNVVRDDFRKRKQNWRYSPLDEFYQMEDGCEMDTAIIERLTTTALIREVRARLSPHLMAALDAYNNNEPVQMRDVYEARRMAKRMKQRIEGQVAV